MAARTSSVVTMNLAGMPEPPEFSARPGGRGGRGRNCRDSKDASWQPSHGRPGPSPILAASLRIMPPGEDGVRSPSQPPYQVPERGP